jgi:hypothetical protein
VVDYDGGADDQQFFSWNIRAPEHPENSGHRVFAQTGSFIFGPAYCTR